MHEICLPLGQSDKQKVVIWLEFLARVNSQLLNGATLWYNAAEQNLLQTGLVSLYEGMTVGAQTCSSKFVAELLCMEIVEFVTLVACGLHKGAILPKLSYHQSSK
jgi:hypothetical protein